MPDHPFFDALSYPWSQHEAQVFHRKLYSTVRLSGEIELLYQQSGGASLLTPQRADLAWKEVLDLLTLERGLQRFCEIVISSPHLAPVHAAAIAIRDAKDLPPAFPGINVPPRPKATATNNLPHHNLVFIGREGALADLDEMFRSRGPLVPCVVFTGLGGIGKTQTALAYCYEHLSEYRLIWWIRAGSEATASADFIALAEPLGLSGSFEQETLRRMIRRELQATEHWLLVFDSVQQPDLPNTFLPPTGVGCALFTSQRTDFMGYATEFKLGLLSQNEALKILAGNRVVDDLGSSDLDQAKLLADELGSLPLTLAQARAYMVGTGKSFAGYRKLFAQSRSLVMKRAQPSPDYPFSIAQTWQVATVAATRACRAAKPLLEIISFFAPDALPTDVLTSEPNALPKNLRTEMDRDEAIDSLNRFSLIQAKDDALTVHRLVQAVTRDGLTSEQRSNRAEMAIRLIAAALPSPREHANWARMADLLPHATIVAQHAVDEKIALETALKVMDAVGLYYHSRAAWQQAQPMFEKAVEVAEQTFGRGHPSVAGAKNRLARLLHDLGRNKEAERLFHDALEAGEAVLGRSNPAVASIIHNLGRLYYDERQYSKAELLFTEAIAAGEKALGRSSTKVTFWLNDLALLYRDTKRYDEAEALFKEAISLGEKRFGREHPVISGRLSDLALLYRDVRNFPDAELLLKQSIEIGEKTIGRDHPNVAGNLFNLAQLYKETGRCAEAEPLFQEAITTVEKILGKSHQNYALGAYSLASLYCQCGRHHEAEPLLREALAALKKTDEDHNRISVIEAKLASLQTLLGQDT
jgi:tetratricopeptide (TPR) repeat protein